MTTTGTRPAPGRGALRRASRPQGPSPSQLAVLIPTSLSLVLAVSVAKAWSSLTRPVTALVTSIPSPASPGLEPLSPTLAPQVLRWQTSIHRWAEASDLDPNLVAVVMQIESCGDSAARSPSGALGLFQVMPYHFQPGDDPFDPDTNARRGLAYLSGSYLLAQGDLALTLAGYNGGHSVITQPASAWPVETRRYVAWGTGLLNDIASDRVPSPTLTRWLGAGGSALCSQAQLASLPSAFDPYP